jgi:ABC-type transport system involved in multi-copper enzyme maturation permease subunit
MSTSVVTPQAAAPRRSAHGRVTQANVIRSEWTKLWSLRSTRWSLLAAVLSMAALGIIVAAADMSNWAHMSAEEQARYDGVDTGVGGYHMAQLAIGVLGVLVISGEYSTGMIRSSLMAVPRRLPVLWAKIAVFAGVTFVLMLIATLISFFGAQAILAGHHADVTLGSPHALRAVIGTALFLTVLGVLAIGLGGAIRNTAGGIAAFVGLLFVLPGIVAILPHRIGDAVDPYLPLSAAFSIATSTSEGHQLGPWTGFAVFCGYAAIAVVAAAVSIARRDA